MRHLATSDAVQCFDRMKATLLGYCIINYDSALIPMMTMILFNIKLRLSVR